MCLLPAPAEKLSVYKTKILLDVEVGVMFTLRPETSAKVEVEELEIETVLVKVVLWSCPILPTAGKAVPRVTLPEPSDVIRLLSPASLIKFTLSLLVFYDPIL